MRIGVLLAGLIGLAIALYVIAHVGFAAVIAALTSVGWAGLGFLCLFGLAQFLVLGAAWFCLMPKGRLPLFVWGRMVRDAAGEVLPFSQLGGIVIGIRALSLSGMGTADASASAIVDVTTEMMAQIVFILIGAALLAMRSAGSLPPGTPAGIVVVLAGSLAFVVLQRRGIALAEKLAARYLPAMAAHTRDFRGRVQAIYANPARLAASSGLHLIGWTASAFGVWLSVRLIGGRIGWTGAIAIEAVLCALRSAAFVVPGALGVQEAGYAMMMPLFGLPPELGLAVSLLKRAREIVIGGPVLLVWQGLEGRRALAAPGP
ncbi:MAG: flippase-like domain-containing protein [Alphaproteobacteria bacterium]|nr:flippase-like domain-containing protein [Alphaproteobacteria bacterium]MBV9695093.1 flippase-like domain-containing protein [Alphaproteobacteria bacterium]